MSSSGKSTVVTTTEILDGTITNADVSPTAAIAVSKLAHVGAGNVLKSDGTTNIAGQVASGDIADGTIVNADVSASAALALSKIVHVGAGNVLRSNGTTNAAGQVLTGDIATGAVTDVKLGTQKVPKIPVSYPTFAAAMAEAAGLIYVNATPVTDRPGAGSGTSWFLSQIPASHVPTTYGWQLTSDLSDVNELYTRMYNAGVGGPWQKIWHDGNTAGVVSTAKIAANAVSQSAQALGTTSNPSTTSTTPVVIPEMSVVLVCTGGKVVVEFESSFFGSGNINIALGLYMDGVSQGISRSISTPNATTYVVSTLTYEFTPSAGSHTFDIRWNVNSGTASANSVERVIRVHEFKR